jgi:tryptophanyl-tRNA synthetase
MSKSSPDKSSKILLTTSPPTIQKIISKALTDSIPEIYYSPSRPAVSNLISILAAFESRSINDLAPELRKMTMKEFKERVIQSIILGLEGIQRRYNDVYGDRKWLERVRQEGNSRAREVAGKRILEIKKVVGLL